MREAVPTATRGWGGGEAKNNKNMKKIYRTPAVAVVKLNPAGLMAISLNVNDETVDTGEPGVQLGRENKPGQSVWEQSW